MTYQELQLLLTNQDVDTSVKIKALTRKEVKVRPWLGDGGLAREYDTSQHPVMTDPNYRDVVKSDGVEKVTRITYDLPRLAAKRMTELCVGIPAKRVYKAVDDDQRQVAEYMEAVYDRVRINSINVERLNALYGGCEVLTLWYGVPTREVGLYGFDSPTKLRCRNFSPMNGEELYPLFDEYGDLIALSVRYERSGVRWLDCYTPDQHLRYRSDGDSWREESVESITIGKIPAVYLHRPTPIWENAIDVVYEMEWTMSRNGNYLRKNSKPLFTVFADKEEEISYGTERDERREFRTILQYPKGSSAQYITWNQPVENLKFYINELRSSFFTQLQLPDWSYEKMSQQALSGESRKQLFVDAQMKVGDEQGRLLEAFDREVNVVKAFLLKMLPPNLHKACRNLRVETVITPFSINDNRESVETLMIANGGKPIMSQMESISLYGRSDNPDTTLRQIKEEAQLDAFGLTM